VELKLDFDISVQPNDTTCGPTCLHALYRYWGDTIELGEVIREVRVIEGGGTLGVLLGCHALERGYRATIYAYNVQHFDPTWFGLDRAELRSRLVRQSEFKPDAKLRYATDAYLEFLDLGGEVRFEDLSSKLFRRYLDEGVPILTGVSSTYLHRTMREIGPECTSDDVRGEPCGHFVVLCGYDRFSRRMLVADPLHPNPIQPHPDKKGKPYVVGIDRVIASIALGILTYDANLLVLEPNDRAPS